METERLLWLRNRHDCTYADYRGLRLRKKIVWSDNGDMPSIKVLIGFTGVGVMISPHTTAGSKRSYKIEAGNHPGDWVKPQTDTFSNFNAAVDAFVDMILNHHEAELQETTR